MSSKSKIECMKKCLVCLSIMCFVVISCSKSNEETLRSNNSGNAGGNAGCDTVNMKYTANVRPILQATCYSCHGNGQSRAGISLDTYDKVKSQVNNGLLIGTITHAPGYSPMPQGAPKLPDCDINKIKAWIARGALNN